MYGCILLNLRAWSYDGVSCAIIKVRPSTEVYWAESRSMPIAIFLVICFTSGNLKWALTLQLCDVVSLTVDKVQIYSLS